MTTEREAHDTRQSTESSSESQATSDAVTTHEELTIAPEWGASEGSPQSGPNLNWRYLIGGSLLALLFLLAALAVWDLLG